MKLKWLDPSITVFYYPRRCVGGLDLVRHAENLRSTSRGSSLDITVIQRDLVVHLAIRPCRTRQTLAAGQRGHLLHRARHSCARKRRRMKARLPDRIAKLKTQTLMSFGP